MIAGTSLAAHHVDPRPGDVKHSYADIAKAERLLGLAPEVSLEDGLAITVDSFRS